MKKINKVQIEMIYEKALKNVETKAILDSTDEEYIKVAYNSANFSMKLSKEIIIDILRQLDLFEEN